MLTTKQLSVALGLALVFGLANGKQPTIKTDDGAINLAGASGATGLRVTGDGDTQFATTAGAMQSIRDTFAAVDGVTEALKDGLDNVTAWQVKNGKEVAEGVASLKTSVTKLEKDLGATDTKLAAAALALGGKTTKNANDIDVVEAGISQVKKDIKGILLASDKSASSLNATLAALDAKFAAVEKLVKDNKVLADNKLNQIVTALKDNGIIIIETFAGGPYQSCTDAKWKLGGKAQSGHYFLNPAGLKGKGPSGKFIGYCDQETDFGGWTLIASLPRSNTVKPGGCCSPNQCSYNQGDPWYFDSDWSSSEANTGAPIPNKRGYAYLRQWKDFYRGNGHTKIMMTYGTAKVVGKLAGKGWCAKKEKQNRCFGMGGSARAYGYARVEQLYVPKKPKDRKDASKGYSDGYTRYGNSEMFLTSCTGDCSTCDQDENLHFRNDQYGGYYGWGGNYHGYGAAWKSPNNAGVTWGGKRMANPTSGDWPYPLNFWVAGNTIEDLVVKSTKVFQTCMHAKKADKSFKSGVYYVNPTGFKGGQGPKYTGTLYKGDTSKGQFPVYCDMEVAGGGWTLLGVIHQSNSLYRSHKRSPNNNGNVHRGDKWYFEAEDQNALYPQPYARRPYNRVWKNYYRGNGHSKIMMKVGSGVDRWVTAKLKKWCNNAQSQASCFPGSGGGRAWGYALTEQPRNKDGAVGGDSTWYLNSCTADASTCDQDENLHFKPASRGRGYAHANSGTNVKYYGLLWNSPNVAQIRWGNKILQGNTDQVYNVPVSIWVG